MSALEWAPEASEETPLASEAERIRQELIRRRDQARVLLGLAAQPLLDADWHPVGWASVTVDLQGQSLQMRAVVALKDAADRLTLLQVTT